jgi:DNA-binding CsgD family transcriptional regulator
MDTRVEDGLRSLTEREKQTLRLMVRGHDTKSIARTLDLSVHTINERLRGARQKLEVPSSREAARLLLAAEGDPQSFGSNEIGDAEPVAAADQEAAPIVGAGRRTRPSRFTIGVIAMSLILGLLALAAAPQTATISQPAAAAQATDPAVVDAARRFVTLIDDSRWADSYQATAASFRKLNTLQAWSAASEQVRKRFGATVSRTLLSQEEVPAPPHGYQVVKFRTSFANKPDAVETVSLDRENGQWRVVGIYVE